MWYSALATMFVGNFTALTQTNIKRLLAYSSIAHAGYIMVAIAAANQLGVEAVMFYLAASERRRPHDALGPGPRHAGTRNLPDGLAGIPERLQRSEIGRSHPEIAGPAKTNQREAL